MLSSVHQNMSNSARRYVTFMESESRKTVESAIILSCLLSNVSMQSSFKVGFWQAVLHYID